jgi:hypothetical protein
MDHNTEYAESISIARGIKNGLIAAAVIWGFSIWGVTSFIISLHH